MNAANAAASVAAQLQTVQKSPQDTAAAQATVLEQGYANYAQAKTGSSAYNPEVWTQYVSDVSQALSSMGAAGLQGAAVEEGQREAQSGDNGAAITNSPTATSPTAGLDTYSTSRRTSPGMQPGGSMDLGVEDPESSVQGVKQSGAANTGSAGDLLPTGTTLHFSDSSSYVVRPGQAINKNELPAGTTWSLPGA